MNIDFAVIGLTRLEIKSESTAPEANTLATWSSEMCTTEIQEHVRLKSKLCMVTRLRFRVY